MKILLILRWALLHALDLFLLHHLQLQKRKYKKRNGYSWFDSSSATNLKQSKIMKLIERLKPEYKQILEDQKNRFPSLVSDIMEALEEEEFILEIKYGIWSNLEYFTKVDTPFKLFEG
jgi:uncharacterized membrane protein